jgi:hypothetical protein
VSHAHVDFARVVEQFVTRPVRVEQDNMDIRLKERRVVVASIPKNNIGFLFRLPQDATEIDSGVDRYSPLDVRLVFFYFLNGALLRDKIVKRGEALNDLIFEVPIGHGVTHYHHLPVEIPQNSGDFAGCLGFAAPGPNGANGYNRLIRLEHSVGGCEQDEIRPFRHGDRSLVHQVGVRYVTVGEGHKVNPMLSDEPGEIVFRVNRYAAGVGRTCQFGWNQAPHNVWNLRSREGDYVVARIVFEIDVEIVQVATRSAHNDDSLNHIDASLPLLSGEWRIDDSPKAILIFIDKHGYGKYEEVTHNLHVTSVF